MQVPCAPLARSHDCIECSLRVQPTGGTSWGSAVWFWRLPCRGVRTCYQVHCDGQPEGNAEHGGKQSGRPHACCVCCEDGKCKEIEHNQLEPAALEGEAGQEGGEACADEEGAHR